MHYGKIKKADSANGIGVRLSLFVSGCTNKCKGCFQPETWDFEYGNELTVETKVDIVCELQKPFYDGITILGGEPFEIENQKEVSQLILLIKERCPDKTIWMYSGFTYEKDLVPGGIRYTDVTDTILDNIDVLVDGRFIESRKNISLRFRGSENQRIIDMRKTRETGKVALSEYN